jgi:hypothetical protein
LQENWKDVKEEQQQDKEPKEQTELAGIETTSIEPSKAERCVLCEILDSESHDFLSQLKK